MSLLRNYKREYEELLAKFEDLSRRHDELEDANGSLSRVTNEVNSLKYDLDDLTSKVARLRNEESDLSILVFSKQSELDRIEDNRREAVSEYNEKSRILAGYETEIVEKQAQAELAARELTAVLGKMEATRLEYEEYDKGLVALREEESSKRTSVIRLQEEIDQLKYEKEKYSNLEVLKVRFDEVNDRVQDALKQRADLEFEIKDLEQSRRNLIDEITRIRNEMISQRTLFEQHVLQEKVAIEKELMQMRVDLDDAIKQRQDRLAILDRELSEAKIRYSKIAAATDTLIEELNENEKKVQMLKVERDNLQDESNALNKRVETLASKASALDAEVQLLTRQVDRLNDERQITSGLLEQIRGSIQGLTGSKEAIIENITRLNQQLVEKNRVYSDSFNEHQELLEHIQSRKIEAVNLKGIIEIRSRKLRDIDRELASLEALRDEYESDLRQILDLQKSLSADLTNSQENVQSLQDTIAALRKKFTEILKIRKARQESVRRERAKEAYEEEDDYADDTDNKVFKPGTVASEETLKAIYADTDPDALDDLKHIFAGSRVDLITVESGSQAFDELKTEPYDLAFFDLNLPGMSPIEIIERMRASNVYKTIPIFAMLDAPDENLQLLAFDAGATNIIYKPLSPEIVISEVKKYLPI